VIDAKSVKKYLRPVILEPFWAASGRCPMSAKIQIIASTLQPAARKLVFMGQQ